MRKLSKAMMGLLVGATLMTPMAAQAQDQDRGHGGWRGGGGDAGAQRGGGGGGDAGAQRGGWQRGSGDQSGGNPGRGGDPGAVANGAARHEAVQQGREANRQVERPAPVGQPQAPVAPRAEAIGQGRRQWQGNGNGNGSRGDWNRGQDNRARDSEANDQRRQAAAAEMDRQRNANDQRERGRDDNRNLDRNHDVNRNWATERRGDNRDGNRSWTTNRRDWGGNDHRAWNHDWRGDRRYNWQSYRNQHRDIYRLPRYEARFGYSYHRWYPGYRFDPWFYSSSFWIDDPFYYRLPPAYGPYRWVRYYDDAVLVDTDTGEIEDILYNFFF